MSGKKPQVLVDAEVAGLADLYISLITELHAINTQYEKDFGQLAACESAVVALKRFLDANEMVFAAGITRHLGSLAAALLDLQSGAKPKLFQVASRPGRGRPPSAIHHAVKATAAACLEILHENAKEDLKTASAFVARELQKISSKVTGSVRPITAATVRGWRDEMGSRNSSVSNKIFSDIVVGITQESGRTITSASARRISKSMLGGIVAEGLTAEPSKENKSE